MANVIKIGVMPWVGTWHCGLCDSIFTTDDSDKDQMMIEWKQDYGLYPPVERRKVSMRCPVCGTSGGTKRIEADDAH